MKCCRKVYLDWGTGWQDVSHLVKSDTLTITKRAASNTYHKAQNYVSFTLIYEQATFQAIYGATEKIKVQVIAETTESLYPSDTLYPSNTLFPMSAGATHILFTGIIPPTASRKYNGILDNTTLSMEGVDSQDLLDVEVGDWYLEDCTIMNPANKAKSIIHQLAYLAGFTDSQIDQTITINKVFDAFAPNGEKDKILTIMDILLFEHGYVFNMNSEDQISPVQWIGVPSSIFTFEEEHIIKEITVKEKERNYDAIEVTWYELDTMDNVRIYTESLPYANNGQFEGYPVPSTYYYPVEANVTDRTTGSLTLVYQEYTDTGIEYKTNEAILNNLDYNYKAFDSDFSSIIITKNHVLYDDREGLTLVASEFGNKKARILYRNNQATLQNLYYMYINATVTYKSSERILKAGIETTSELTDKYESYFIFDAESADILAQNMVQMYGAGNTEYKFDSEIEIAEGTFVNLITNDATNLTCFVTEKQYSEKTGLFSYTLVGYSYNEGVIISEDVSRSSGAYEAYAAAVAAEAQAAAQEALTSVQDFDEYPSTPSSLTAIAQKEGISLLTVPGGTPSRTNTLRGYIYQLSRNAGVTWTDSLEGSSQVIWNFNRSIDGYPSATTLADYRIRVKAVSITGAESVDWLVVSINTGSYLGWTPTAPSAGIRASNRAITLGWQAQNDICYGDLKYEIQVCKAIQADGSDTPADRELAASWRGPSSVDIYGLSATFEALLAGNDPADEGYKYRYGDKTDAWGGAAESVVAVTGSAYVHALPLDQEVVIVTRDTGDYLSTVALDTLYYYRIRAVSYDGETLVQSGAWCAEISASAAASSALDVVRNMLNTATIVDGSIVAEKLFVEMLSAITANMGQITDGALVGNENNYWILTTGEYGGVTRYAGDFRVGNELGDYFKCVWNPVTEKYEIDLKASSFRITAEGTEFDGEMIVTNDSDPTRRCRVTSEGVVWERREGGVWVTVGEMTQDLLGNLTLTNDPGNAPTPLIEPPSVDSVYYHFDDNMLDQNGENGADITATGTLTAPTIIRGKCLAGSVSKELGEAELIGLLNEITLSAAMRYRPCCWEKDGILYFPLDLVSAMERYDIATESMLPEITLSAVSRSRRCCWEKDGILYFPINNSTVMERYDIATESMLPEITLSAVSRSRHCCWEKDGILYIPAHSSTVMERYEIATESMLPEITLSAVSMPRPCCWEKDGILYFPLDLVSAMERYDIATESMLPEITLSAVSRSRRCCWEKDGILYFPINNSTVMERYDIATESMLPEITLSSSNRRRYTCVAVDGILYFPIENSTVMERYDIATESMLSEITLSSSNRERYTCVAVDGILYFPIENSTVMERYDPYYFLTLPLTPSPFSTLAAWFKGSITLPGNVEIFADSSAWYYVMLSTSGNEITYTIYSLDGTEVLSDSYDYVGRYATPPSTDLILTGHIDELIYDATTALDPTTAIESKLPWGYGLDASKTWLVLHAKDPAAVSSNAFLTRDVETYGTLPVADSTDKQLVLDATDGSWKLVESNAFLTHPPVSTTSRIFDLTGDRAPAIPDDPAGVTYRGNGFTSLLFGWLLGNCTATFSNGEIILTATTTGAVLYHGLPAIAGKLQVYRVRKISGAGTKVRVYFSTYPLFIKEYDIRSDDLCVSSYIPASNTVGNTGLHFPDSVAGDVFAVSEIYLGTGAYLSKLVDRAGVPWTNYGALPVDGPFGKGLQFNGAQYLQAPGPMIGTTGTIAIKFKPDNLAQTARIVDTTESSGFAGFRFVQVAAALVLVVSGDSASQQIPITNSLTVSEHTFEFNLIGTTLKWSYDSSALTTVALSVTPVASTEAMTLGRATTSASQFFTGTIYAFRADSRVWTDDEIARWSRDPYSEDSGLVDAFSLSFANLPTFADNAAAIAGKLPAGKLYKTRTGNVLVRY